MVIYGDAAEDGWTGDPPLDGDGAETLVPGGVDTGGTGAGVNGCWRRPSGVDTWRNGHWQRPSGGGGGTSSSDRNGPTAASPVRDFFC